MGTRAARAIAAVVIPDTVHDEETIPVRRARPELFWVVLEPVVPPVDEDELPDKVFDEVEDDRDRTEEVAAVPLALGGALESALPTSTSSAGVTGEFELAEFWYGTAPASCAADVMFHPLAFMTG